MGGYAWVTLATNDAYSLGALVLAYSLRRVGTKYDLAVMVTPGVTAMMREKLATVFSLVQEVNVLDSKDESNLALLSRPELGITFTKLHCWRLTQYEKCVFVDADTLVVRNCDELFEREELSAAPDVGWPDCFNSGVFVFKPSQETFTSITAFAASKGSFDGGDQGLLNMYFSDWSTKDISKHLPFIYNMCSTATYSYLPAFKQFGEDVKIIHFIGITKPWLQYFDTLTGIVQPPVGSGHLQPLLQLWWNIFCEQVHPQLSASMATSTLAPIWHKFTPLSFEPSIPNTSVYSVINYDIHDIVQSQTPDFSEFKDPWKDYCPQNDPFLMSNSILKEKREKCYCGTEQSSPQTTSREYEKEKELSYQNGHNISQLNHKHYSAFDSPQMNYQQYVIRDEHKQDREYGTLHFEEKHNECIAQNTDCCQEQRIQQNNQQRHQKHDEQQHHNKEHHYNKQDDNHTQYEAHDIISNSGEQLHSPETGDKNLAEHYTCNNSRVNHQNSEDHLVFNNDSCTQHAIRNSCAVSNGNQFEQNNFISRCQSKNNEQFSEVTNKQTPIQRITSYFLPSPTPCTDLHNVSTRSDMNVTEHLDNANAGIAGALARMTLGQPRSAEQIALEEHMRKQSWEQGQIDYMGRDSFDNIWKKICETLSFAPQQQPTPPKEDVPKSEESIIAVETTAQTVAPVNVEIDQSTVKADKDPTQEQSPICKVPEEKLSSPITCKISDRGIIAMQLPEQKVHGLPSENITDPIQTAVEGICTKPVTESQDLKSCVEATLPKASMETSLLKMSMEPFVETITEQCKLVSSTTQEIPSQDKSCPLRSPTQDLQSAELQISSCLLPDAICKLSMQAAEVVTPIITDSTLASTEGKSSTPAPANQHVIYSTPTSQVATSPVQSEITAEDIAKPLTELVSDVTRPLMIDPQMKSEQHAEILSAASEISTVSPVPIQVAESVLQAEPKESMLGTATAVTDEAIATTITAVRESTEVPLATIVETEDAVQLNGSTCEVERRSDVAIITGVNLSTVLPDKADITTKSASEQSSDSVMMKDTSSKTQLVIEKKTDSDKSTIPPEMLPAKELLESTQQAVETVTAAGMVTTQIAQTEMAKEKSSEQLTKTEPTKAVVKTGLTEKLAKSGTTEATAEAVVEFKTTEIIAKSETAEAATTKPIEPLKQAMKIDMEEAAADESSSEVPESPSTEDPSLESIESKAPNIPSTPTVIEATPPTSPSVESAQQMESQEKVAKKTLKKSDSADGTDGDSADKKGAKKTVKKITKKPKLKSEEVPAAESAADSSQSKAKKTVKAVKKPSTKTGQTLEADTSVPETPPPSTSDVPVPPKRKTKSTTSTKGTTGKKSETEE